MSLMMKTKIIWRQDSDTDDTDDFTPESYDEYLTAQVLLPQGGEASKATVVSRKRDHDVDRLESAMQIHCWIPVCMKLNSQMVQQKMFLPT